MTPVLQDKIEVDPFPLDPGILITAKSYLIDRMVPNCEIITLPGREARGGIIPFGVVDKMPPPPLRGGWRGFLKGERRRKPVVLQGKLGMDCRVVSPENWSHFLNIHAPLAFELARRLGLAPADLTLILPTRTPGFILRAADYLGFVTQCTDAPVDGPGVAYRLREGITVPDRLKWLNATGIIDRLATVDGPPLPSKVFLARRNTRALLNQAEIEALLRSLGYTTIYPEDLPVAEQFRLFNHAESLVAIHGAGLAPLLYRRPGGSLRQLIEIMPAGHMADYFRLMAQQVDCSWIGVRGRLKKEYFPLAYMQKGLFRKYSLDNFEVDSLSLQKALVWNANAPCASFF